MRLTVGLEDALTNPREVIHRVSIEFSTVFEFEVFGNEAQYRAYTCSSVCKFGLAYLKDLDTKDMPKEERK